MGTIAGTNARVDAGVEVFVRTCTLKGPRASLVRFVAARGLAQNSSVITPRRVVASGGDLSPVSRAKSRARRVLVGAIGITVASGVNKREQAAGGDTSRTQRSLRGVIRVKRGRTENGGFIAANGRVPAVVAIAVRAQARGIGGIGVTA